MTHQATSNITECGLRMMSGCQMFHGRPRSYMSAAHTSKYPMNAVRMVGRTMECHRLMLKISTAAVRVKPPAASMTPHITSKPIQSPQGNWSLRLVEAPSPKRKRTQVAYTPAAMMNRKMAFQKVKRNVNLDSGTVIAHRLCCYVCLRYDLPLRRLPHGDG